MDARNERKVELMAVLAWMLRTPKSTAEICEGLDVSARMACWYIDQERRAGKRILKIRIGKTFKYQKVKNAN